jgi:hypothetical protein
MDNGNISGACIVTGLWVLLPEYNSHICCDLYVYDDMYAIIANKNDFAHADGIPTDFIMHDTFRVGETLMAHASLCDAVSMHAKNKIERYMPELLAATGYDNDCDEEYDSSED